ncbi:MAG: hypothetical protein CME80_08770 [Halomonas sp.]|nr:hypothetical protein [Halomonas sp.]
MLTSYYYPFLQDWVIAENFMDYEHAIVKFEDGIGTLFCNGCGIIIAEGTQHEDREHYCTMCMSGNCKAKFKDGN